MMCSINQRSKVKRHPDIFSCFYSMVTKSYVHDSSFFSVESMVSFAACVSGRCPCYNNTLWVLQRPIRSCDTRFLLPTTSEQINAKMLLNNLGFRISQINIKMGGLWIEFKKQRRKQDPNTSNIHLILVHFYHSPFNCIFMQKEHLCLQLASTVPQIPQELRYSRALRISFQFILLFPLAVFSSLCFSTFGNTLGENGKL